MAIYSTVIERTDGTSDGTHIGQSATEKLGFFGATPTAQPTNADQAAVTDSSGGTKSSGTGVAANANKETVTIGLGTLANLANGQVWKVALPYSFTVTAAWIRAGIPVTTAAKAATLTIQVNGTPVTGGVISATSAGLATTGVTQLATAITGANTGTAGQTLEVAVSNVTAFVEGSGRVEMTVTNNDQANTAATFAAQTNAIRSALVTLGLIKGA